MTNSLLEEVDPLDRGEFRVSVNFLGNITTEDNLECLGKEVRNLEVSQHDESSSEQRPGSESLTEALLERSNLCAVIAPETLPGGYRFVASVEGGAPFVVTVPPGGIKKGSRFFVPSFVTELPRSVVPPRGRWRNPWYSCCYNNLCCKPIWWLAFCCPLVATGQIMARLRLNCIGLPTSDRNIGGTFSNLLFLSLFGGALQIYIAVFGVVDNETSDEIFAFQGAVFLGFFAFSVYLALLTRLTVRSRYRIPAKLGCCEDCCCVCCCMVCTLCQMADHTADYSTYPSLCCTYTGLPNNIPAVV